MGYYVRFLIFLFSILLTLYFVWFGFKIHGENQPLSPFQTNLVKTLKKHPGPVLWKRLGSQNSSDQFLWFNTTFSNSSWLTNDNSKIPLEAALKDINEKFKVIFIEVNSPEALPSFRKILNKDKAWEKTIICSRADGVLKDLREMEPEWTFCSGEIFLTRFLALNSIALGPLAPIRADVFFLHLQEIQLNKSLAKIFAEAKRQNKLIFSGPIARPIDGFPIDHWLVQ